MCLRLDKVSDSCRQPSPPNQVTTEFQDSLSRSDFGRDNHPFEGNPHRFTICMSMPSLTFLVELGGVGGQSYGGGGGGGGAQHSKVECRTAAHKQTLHLESPDCLKQYRVLACSGSDRLR